MKTSDLGGYVIGIALVGCLSFALGHWAGEHGYVVKNEFGYEFWFVPDARQWVNDNICFWRW